MKLLKFIHRCLCGLINFFRRKSVKQINKELHEITGCDNPECIDDGYEEVNNEFKENV